MANRFPPRWKRSKKTAEGNAEGGGATLQEIESRLRLGPELDKFGHKVVEALARAVLRFVEGNSGETTINRSFTLAGRTTRAFAPKVRRCVRLGLVYGASQC